MLVCVCVSLALLSLLVAVLHVGGWGGAQNLSSSLPHSSVLPLLPFPDFGAFPPTSSRSPFPLFFPPPLASSLNCLTTPLFLSRLLRFRLRLARAYTIFRIFLLPPPSPALLPPASRTDLMWFAPENLKFKFYVVVV